MGKSYFESCLRIISIGPYNSAVYFIQGHDIDFVLLSSLVYSIMAKSTIKPDLRCIVYITSHLELTFLQHQTMRFSLQNTKRKEAGTHSNGKSIITSLSSSSSSSTSTFRKAKVGKGGDKEIWRHADYPQQNQKVHDFLDLKSHHKQTK